MTKVCVCVCASCACACVCCVCMWMCDLLVSMWSRVQWPCMGHTVSNRQFTEEGPDLLTTPHSYRGGSCALLAVLLACLLLWVVTTLHREFKMLTIKVTKNLSLTYTILQAVNAWLSTGSFCFDRIDYQSVDIMLVAYMSDFHSSIYA